MRINLVNIIGFWFLVTAHGANAQYWIFDNLNKYGLEDRSFDTQIMLVGYKELDAQVKLTALAVVGSDGFSGVLGGVSFKLSNQLSVIGRTGFTVSDRAYYKYQAMVIFNQNNFTAKGFYINGIKHDPFYDFRASYMIAKNLKLGGYIRRFLGVGPRLDFRANGKYNLWIAHMKDFEFNNRQRIAVGTTIKFNQ
ncbi:hypothetical protein [Flagellimonas algicola]|uniref:Outer membrane protein with beta-barrel domain n=1 Tax=Flagellimonas algicola TaxID=2583815 RepID=A0ABY2WGB5_9FLAO|nr:hypothetical protein [Allomuricauda algicola]TMU50398.1 hypothetical protein FGG15_19820 [Allomuricauda algicola]